MKSLDLPSYDEIDSLVDTDTLKLRDVAWDLVREVERLRATRSPQAAADASDVQRHPADPAKPGTAILAGGSGIPIGAPDALAAFRAARHAHRLAEHPDDLGSLPADCCDTAGLDGVAPLLAAEAIQALVPALLAAVRCIPDGEIRNGCVVSDGATVRRRLKAAYNAIRFPDRETEAVDRG